MKMLPALFIACFIWSPAVFGQNKTDREQAGLIGPVRAVEAYIVDFTLREGKTEPGKRWPWHTTRYNPEGNIVERITYDDRSGNVSAKYVHTYDEKGRSTGYEEYSATLDKTLTVPRKHVYILDERGNKIEYKVYESDGTTAIRFTYKYDAKGNKIEEGFYYHTGRFGGKTVYTYDESGNQTGQTSYGADGAVNSRTVTKFDGKGNVTERLQYQGDTLRYKFIFSYDEKGRVLESETIEFDAGPSRWSHAPVPGKVVYAYDDEKRTKEVASYTPDGTLKDHVIYSYDHKGNEVGRAAFKRDGSPDYTVLQFYDNTYEPGSKFRGSLSGESLAEFAYDSRGNWTKKIYLLQPDKGAKPQPYRAEERIITYH